VYFVRSADIMGLDMSSVTDWISAVSSAVSAAGILGAGWWFLETNQRKQRVQFDVDCRFFRPPDSKQLILAEVWCVFDNKGFVEHRLYDLCVSVHVDVPSRPQLRGDAPIDLWFPVISRKSIVPAETRYYFVRPGVNQVIRHVVKVPETARLVRVTASFGYHRDDKHPHIASRIFAVDDEGERRPLIGQPRSERSQVPESRSAPGGDMVSTVRLPR